MNGIFTLNWGSVGKGLVVAILAGAALPISAMVQTPGFDIHSVNVDGLLNLALNGAIVGFVSYIAKEFLSDSNGKVLGRIG